MEEKILGLDAELFLKAQQDIEKAVKESVESLKQVVLDENNEYIEETRQQIEKILENLSVNNPSPFMRLMVTGRKLRQLHARYQAGDSSAILEAMTLCFSKEFMIPQWCIEAFRYAYNDIKVNFVSKSWDAVFGKPHRKGMHLAAAQQEKELMPYVYELIKTIKEISPQTPIEQGLFEAVGKELGISGSTARDYYYKAKKKNKKPS